MKVIKFRGRRIDNGEWAYGYYAVHKMMQTGEMDYFIIVDEQRPQSVNPETVGQFTGLKDKNGMEIFEDDITNCFLNGERMQRRTIKWIDFMPSFMGIDQDGRVCGFDHGYKFEVIGNIYENPELLKLDLAKGHQSTESA